MQKWEYLGVRFMKWGIAMTKPEQLEWLKRRHPAGNLNEDTKNISFQVKISWGWREYYDYIDKLGEAGWEMVDREKDGLIFKRPLEE